MVDYGHFLREEGIDTRDKEAVLQALRRTHGDIEDAKAAMILIADEEGFEIETEDVEAVTDEPPNNTFL